MGNSSDSCPFHSTELEQEVYHLCHIEPVMPFWFLVHFDKQTLVPNSIEHFFHVEECHVCFTSLVTEGLNGLLKDEGRVNAA